MGKIAVWSERIAGAAAYRNCTYCALLTVLRYAGFTTTANPEAEHQALAAADDPLADHLEETFVGASYAVKARYAIDVHLVPDQSPAGIVAALRVAGRATAIAGKLSNMGTDAAGLFLRRYAPTFTGFHALTVVTLGSDLFQWLDPMAPEGYGGDRVTLAQVQQFIGTNYPLDARYLSEDELVGGDMAIISKEKLFLGADGKPALRGVDLAAGLHRGWHLDGTGKDFNFPTATSAGAEARCSITGRPDAPVGTPFLTMMNGVFVTGAPWYFFEDGVKVKAQADPEPPPPVIREVIKEVIVEVPVPGEPLPSDVDVAGAIEDLNLLTADLNAVYRARAAAVTHKNSAKLKLGG